MSKQGKKWALGMVLGTSALLSLPADAGQKFVYEVTVAVSAAYGSLGSARASSDANQMIGCSSYGNSGYCYARDRNNSSAMCLWSTPAQAQAVASLTDLSYIYFTFDSSGNCATVYVANYSYFLPPTP
jgi:hypothetical protein